MSGGNPVAAHVRLRIRMDSVDVARHQGSSLCCTTISRAAEATPISYSMKDDL